MQLLEMLYVACQAANIAAERLASFDRPIKSEPHFKQEQTEGLLRDLTAYLQTLKVGPPAVHHSQLARRLCRWYCIFPSSLLHNMLPDAEHCSASLHAKMTLPPMLCRGHRLEFCLMVAFFCRPSTPEQTCSRRQQRCWATARCP